MCICGGGGSIAVCLRPKERGTVAFREINGIVLVGISRIGTEQLFFLSEDHNAACADYSGGKGFIPRYRGYIWKQAAPDIV